ncbi:MAG TPA: glycerol kinase GlpK [Clostridium sp.]|uniref:glycerol kinase GlpK n=1 Tax=Clostridium sp. TaxID=1506 RepID=UPI002F9263BD
MENKYILAIDQSTSGSKALLVDNKGIILEKVTKAHKQIYPSIGWVEHDPIEILENVKSIINKLLDKVKINKDEIKVLSITNQRETVVVWDAETGIPVYNAIVWQCRRTTKICEELRLKGYEEIVEEKTGLRLDPYFSASKVKWILENVHGAKEKAKRGTLILGNIDTWLIWNLTGGKVHATDYTNASRTLLFNIKDLHWDTELLEIFQIPSSMLPDIKCSDKIFGNIKCKGLNIEGIPIAGIIGDSQGALFGQLCFEKGMAKATYGTGSSIMVNIGDEFVQSKNGLVTALAWGINDKVEYAVEGIINCSGDTINWVKENLGLVNNFSQIEPMINGLIGNQGVYLVPAFVGLGVPYWEPKAKAAIIGMNRDTKKENIVRAAVESIAYQIKDALVSIEKETKIHLKEIRVDGGASSNNFLMQFQADILGINVVKSLTEELSLMGSVYIAGLGVGIWRSREELQNIISKNKVYSPSMDIGTVNKYYDGWKKAIKKVLA